MIQVIFFLNSSSIKAQSHSMLHSRCATKWIINLKCEYFSAVEVIVENLPDIYVDKLLVFLATQIENTTHIEFYLLWVNRILMIHGLKLKQRSQRIISCVRTLQKNVNRKYEDIGKM